MAKKSKIEVGEVNTYIVTWLKNYATQAKVNGFVVGISGGVDSAVTSTLCAQTTQGAMQWTMQTTINTSIPWMPLRCGRFCFSFFV